MIMPRKQSLCMLLVACLLVVVVVDLVVTMRLAVDIRASAARVCKQPALPCGAIPTRFVLEEPECADKLLKSMNVTNVRVLLPKALAATQAAPQIRGAHNLSEEAAWGP